MLSFVALAPTRYQHGRRLCLLALLRGSSFHTRASLAIYVLSLPDTCVSTLSSPNPVYQSLALISNVSWPRIPQDLCSTREDPSMDRRQAESPGPIAALCISGSKDIWSLWRAPYCKPRGGSTDTLKLFGIYAASGNLRLIAELYIFFFSCAYST